MITSYIHVNLLDGTENMALRENMTVTVDGEKIVSVEAGENPASGAEIVDLGGRYMMPGLINLHVHLPASGKPNKKPVDNKKLAKLIKDNKIFHPIGIALGRKSAKTELLSGTTTIRAVGGVGDFDSRLRDEINAKKSVGPRILCADMAIAVEGGHMVGTVAVPAHNVEEIVSLVEERAKAGVDFIKLMITGGVLDAKVKGEPGELKMPPEYVRAACDTAHKHGLKVAAHVESPLGVKVAVEGGVDTVEHGADIEESLISIMKEKGTALVCTFSPAIPLARFDAEVTGASELTRYNSEVVLDNFVEGAKKALANGIPIGLGTDTGCPFVTHYDMWRELFYYTKFTDVTPAYALYTATLGNAKIVGIDKETGSVEVGKKADLLITEKNPLDDFSVMRAPYAVVMKGKRIDSPRVKKYAAAEEVLDAFAKIL